MDVRRFLLAEIQRFDQCRSMNSQASSSRADLEFAEVTLRDILIGEFGVEANADAKSLGRMLIHLVNMQEAICISSECHANMAKRLGDTPSRPRASC